MLHIDYFILHLRNEFINNPLHAYLNSRLFIIELCKCMDSRNHRKMDLDNEYYNQLKLAINGEPAYFKEEIWHTIDDWTDEPDKMLWHLKYYIDHRMQVKELDLVLSDDYITAGKLTKFKIIEFFQAIINDYPNLPPTLQPCPFPEAPPEPVRRKKDPFQQIRPTAKQGDLGL